MPSFFDKLNTLVKAHINDIIDPMDEESRERRRRAIERRDIRSGLEGDVATLRKRIDEALAYEAELERKTNDLRDRMVTLDEQADQAVAAGREDQARKLLGEMQQAQRELEMTEADLYEHRTITQDLITQVNTLDGVVQTAKEREDPQEPAPNVSRSRRANASSEQADRNEVEQFTERISQQLDSTRQKLGDLINEYSEKAGLREPRESVGPTPEERQADVERRRQQTTHPVDRRRVEDDLSARRDRLSRPPREE